MANDVTRPGAGFGTDTNIASLITKDGMEERPLQSKRELADGSWIKSGRSEKLPPGD